MYLAILFIVLNYIYYLFCNIVPVIQWSPNILKNNKFLFSNSYPWVPYKIIPAQRGVS